ncbi:hydroxymethylglutaryl-CoA synthase [Streptomyces cyaneofuscatus]|uniref:hydroxymethylglutaryl-CoA synthase n=1 Tax=Streptomyces cyaneofuscatus TaxID=66883 RepID=UPI0036584A33
MHRRPEVGIRDLTFRTTSLSLTHAELARHTGANIAKYHKGIGQRAMSVPATDEDIVTMAADAVAAVLQRHGTTKLRTLLFATESSIDQSKAAGVYVHSLLGLPSHVRVVELKQACYGATAALQLAAALVHSDYNQQVLVVASDIARYDLNSPGESTQGAAAAAMLVSAEPALAAIERPSGLHTQDVMDFWRPNYRTTALVDGKKSLNAYLDALEGAWTDYRKHGGRKLNDLAAVCYHQPFTRMAHKAHHRLLRLSDLPTSRADIGVMLSPTTTYNETIGNSYTASLYLALASLLDSKTELEGQPIGLFSYGSGCVAEFLTVRIMPGYRRHLRTAQHERSISGRRSISYEEYRQHHALTTPTDGTTWLAAQETTGPYRLEGLKDHQRIYTPNKRHESTMQPN